MMDSTAQHPADPHTGREETFRAYSEKQGTFYNNARRNYHRYFYKILVDHHKATGGQFDNLLDVGCGPGYAANSLAPDFTHATGIDPSSGMIEVARSISQRDKASQTSSGERVRFEVSSAEELGNCLSPPIADGSIDLITAANAAHWFEMEGFWRAAARVLKPGGSVALWTPGSPQIHPNAPNAVAINNAISELRTKYFEPYTTAGNHLTRSKYVDLLLPWNLKESIQDFDEKEFYRKDWEADEPFMENQQAGNLDMWEKGTLTGSAVTRYYQANPGVARTENDPVKMMRRKLEGLLEDVGIEMGKEQIEWICHGVLLIVKKRL